MCKTSEFCAYLRGMAERFARKNEVEIPDALKVKESCCADRAKADAVFEFVDRVREKWVSA